MQHSCTLIDLAQALQWVWACCQGAQLGPLTTQSSLWISCLVECSIYATSRTIVQSTWISVCHFIVWVYLQFPVGNLFQSMWASKSLPRIFKSVSIIHVLKSRVHITHAIKRGCLWRHLFSPHCHSRYLKSVCEHVSQKSLPEKRCGFRKGDVEIVQFLPVDNLKENNENKTQAFVQSLGIS